MKELEDEIIDIEEELKDEEDAKYSKKIRLWLKLGAFVAITIVGVIVTIMSMIGA